MRTTSVKVSVSTAIVVVLLAAAPAEAARRTTPSPRAQSPRATQVIRQALARAFGFVAQALPTIPIPAAPTGDELANTSTPILPVSDKKR